MADSTTNMPQMADGQPLNRRTFNGAVDALSPASYWGRNADACVDLTWGFLGGVIAGVRYYPSNGTLALTASQTCYIEHTLTGVASFNTSAFTSGSVPDYIAITGTDGVSSYTDVRGGGQALTAALAAISALTPAANKVPYFTSSTAAALADFTAAGRALVDDADAAAQRTTLGLAIGTNVQAYDAELAAVAGLTSAADKGIQFTGSGTAATYDLTTAGKALLDDADAAAQRTTLGLGTVATLASDTDGTLAANSDSRVATQKAVKTYVDGIVTGGASDVMIFKGIIDCSANPNYPAADAGHLYKISVAGKIGGASGVNVEAGDTIYCITDSTASGTQAGVGANWVVAQVNVDGAVTGPASATDSHFAFFNGSTGKIIKDGGAPATVATSGSASDLGSGTLPAGRLPAFTGDATASAGLAALTLATVNSNVGSFTNANITVNAKGLVTAAANGTAGGSSVSPLVFALIFGG